MSHPQLPPVQHDTSVSQFTLTLDGAEAHLKYHLFTQEDGTPAVDFTSTWVPEALRGQGVAERLVREGLRWAKAENRHIQASCWYAKKFL